MSLLHYLAIAAVFEAVCIVAFVAMIVTAQEGTDET